MSELLKTSRDEREMQRVNKWRVRKMLFRVIFAPIGCLVFQSASSQKTHMQDFFFKKEKTPEQILMFPYEY